jgi:hypothetical protein
LPSTKTLNFLIVRKDAVSLMRLVEKINSYNLLSRPMCHVLSKAFSISKDTVAVDILLLKFRSIWSSSLIQWSVILWCARMPSLYIKYSPATPVTPLALFAGNTCIYATEKHERRVLCKLQRGLTAVKSWFERWNIKIIEGKSQTMYFSGTLRVPDDILQLNGRDIPFVSNNVTYHGVTFNRRTIWRLHIEKIVAKALRAYLRT